MDNEDRCFYCYKILVIGDKTKDHLIPISRNGKKLSNNKVKCCLSCIREKAYMTVDEYVSFRRLAEGLSEESRYKLRKYYLYIVSLRLLEDEHEKIVKDIDCLKIKLSKMEKNLNDILYG